MSADKKYCRGNNKQIKFDNGGDIINMSFNVNDFLSDYNHPEQKDRKLVEFADDNGWIKITIAPKKGGADKFGNTHSTFLNEYKPDPKFEGSQGNDPVAAPPEADSNDLPF